MKIRACLLSASLILTMATTACSSEASAQGVEVAGISTPMPLPIFVNIPASRTLRILTCCDSITVGVDGSSYRDELAALLKPRGVEVVWIVAAVPGTPCTEWAPKVKDLIVANRPDILLLNCGTNDVVLSQAQLRYFATTYAQMINDVRAAGVKLAVSKLQISRVSEQPTLQWLPANEAKINKVIDRASKFYGDVGLADMSTIPATPENTTDGVHPSQLGEQQYANAWLAAGSDLGWW